MAFTANYDVIVVGGGIAGVAAALSAAEAGAKVALVEKTALWGGLATAGVIYIYLPLCDGMGHQVSFGLAERLFHAAVAYGPGGVNDDWRKPNPDAAPDHARYRTGFVPAAFILALDECLEQAGVELWLDTVMIATRQEGATVTGIEVLNKGGRGLLHAWTTVDATGDAEVVRNAGGAFVAGENNLAFWGMQVAETGAESCGNHRLSPHFCGVMNGAVEAEATRQALTPRGGTEFLMDSRRWLRQAYRRSGRSREILYPAVLPTLPQFRRSGRIVSRGGIAENTHNSPLPGAVGMAADWCNVGVVQEIPYSAMLPERMDHVIVAGRAVDAAGYGWELARSIPAVAVSGEAAGVAAARCAAEKIAPAHLDTAWLQEALRARGVKPTLHDVGLPYRTEPGYRVPAWLHGSH